MIWETSAINALVEEALALGSSKVELGSARDARLFRAAIYNRFGKPAPVLVSVSDRTVTLKKR